MKQSTITGGLARVGTPIAFPPRVAFRGAAAFAADDPAQGWRSVFIPRPREAKGFAKVWYRAMQSNPKMGETYACDKCGMTLEVLVACKCSDDCKPKLECCGQALTRADKKTAS